MQILTSEELLTPAAMLETLKIAYRCTLDRFDQSEDMGEKRLTVLEETELNRRLIFYWGHNQESNPVSRPRKPNKGDRLVAELRAFAAAKSKR